MTIKALLEEAHRLWHGDDFSVREWLRHLGQYSTMSDFLMHLDDDFKPVDRFWKGFKRLQQGYPVAYLTKETTFMDLTLKVDSNVLIPRPETEELVALTVSLLNRFRIVPLAIADIATGSGAIALALKRAFPKAEVYGTDISEKALSIAQFNSKKTSLNVAWLKGDMCQPLLKKNLKFDVLISNPPYIEDERTIDASVLRYEPRQALLANPATKFYESIFSAANLLRHPGFMTFEIAPSLEGPLRSLLIRYVKPTQFGFELDINRKIRFLWILVK